jgi:hypothetical protein
LSIVHFILIFNHEFMDPCSIAMYIYYHHAIVADTSSFFIKTCLLIAFLYVNRHWHDVNLNLIKMGDSLNTNIILKYLMSWRNNLDAVWELFFFFGGWLLMLVEKEIHVVCQLCPFGQGLCGYSCIPIGDAMTSLFLNSCISQLNLLLYHICAGIFYSFIERDCTWETCSACVLSIIITWVYTVKIRILLLLHGFSPPANYTDWAIAAGPK